MQKAEQKPAGRSRLLFTKEKNAIALEVKGKTHIRLATASRFTEISCREHLLTIRLNTSLQS